MNFLFTVIVLAICLLGMSLGLIINKKRLIKGCSVDPDECKCIREGKNPKSCDLEKA